MFTRKMLVLYGVLGFCFNASYAQEKLGEVTETKNPMIESLQKERASLFRSGNIGSEKENSMIGGDSGTGMTTTAPGYRVQVYSGSSRNEAYAVQARFKRMFREMETYLSYSQPNYRVKVGDFTSRSQAQSLMSELRKHFDSVFVFSETVNIEH